MPLLRRLPHAALALATVGALTGTLLTTSAAGAPSGTAAKPQTVDLALKASGFGTRLRGGQVPAGSGETAFTVIGCTTRAGIDRENHEAEVTIPGLGKASNVKTRLWTREVDGVVSSYARNTVSKLVLAESGIGRLEIRGITAFARAFHDREGFHTETRASVGVIRMVPAVGEAQELELPSPGQPIEIPGLATISVGTTQDDVSDDGARARANTLIIDRTASDSRVFVGQAKAQVLDGVKHGTFRGFSAGTEARGLDDNVTSGRTPLSLMPCQGTDGEVLTRNLEDSDLGGNIVASGLRTAQMGKQLRGRSVAFERGSVARLVLGGGQLEVRGIVGRAHVVREGRKVIRSIKGSTIGTITANGEEQEFPDTEPLEIPGVAKLERFVVDRSPSGIAVVALRITLLDGTGAVIDLGKAKVAIRRR